MEWIFIFGIPIVVTIILDLFDDEKNREHLRQLDDEIAELGKRK